MKIKWKRNAWLMLTCSVLFVACKKEDKPSTAEAADSADKKQCASCMDGPDGNPVVFENDGKKVAVVEHQGNYYLQGDMKLSKAQVAFLKGESKPDARTGIRTFARMWPNRTIYYTINANMPWLMSLEIESAMSDWQNVTNLQFVQRTTEPNYVEFMPHATECNSEIGMVGGRQVINVSPDCMSWGIIHEIAHALGIFHEQSRKDRWMWINVHTQNILPGRAHNFQTYEEMGIPGFRLGAFDFNSIMLYSSNAFAQPGTNTMTRLDGSTFNATMTLSQGDIDTYNHMYNRPYFVITKENVVNIHNSQQTGSTWDCRFRAYTDASMTTLANLPWTFECWLSFTWEDQGAPGGTMSPAKYIISPGIQDFIIGEGYSLRDRQTSIRTKMDYHIYNDGFGD